MMYSGDRQTKESSIEKPPAAVEPIVRSMSFRLSPMLATQWNSNSVVYSQLFNALSIFLPGGEDFFIRAMTLSCKARGPSTESKKVGAFARQESNHRKNHELYNACIAQSLPLVARSLRRMERRWKTVRLVTPLQMQVALTVALEHLTTIIARLVLSKPEILSGADYEYARLWRWHSLEELEHKSVAFDLYRGQKGSRLNLWLIMAIASVFFSIDYSRIFTGLLRDTKCFWRRQTWVVVWQMSRSPAARAMWLAYREFYSKEFDPALVDDLRLILAARAVGLATQAETNLEVTPGRPRHDWMGHCNENAQGSVDQTQNR
jgi:uncharacterized protein